METDTIASPLTDAPPLSSSDWSVLDAVKLYGFDTWGRGFFGVSPEGHVVVQPTGDQRVQADLYQILNHLRERQVYTPLIFRFPQLLALRIEELHESFNRAIKEFNYQAHYQGVFPVKVNQTRNVVQEIHRAGRRYNYGFEVGSKPELSAALAIHDNPNALLLCNGFKDQTYLEMAFLAKRMGKKVIVVCEQVDELPRLLAMSTRLADLPEVGFRCRLYARGAGRWEESSGEASKFGLSTAEMLRGLNLLKERGALDLLKMLHFHIGSQITQVERITQAVQEAARLYCKVYQVADTLKFLNVGGGLAIDYDGSASSSDSSANYSLQEYCNDIVDTVAQVCDSEGIPDPVLVSESGRGVSAYHSLLAVDVRTMGPEDVDISNFQLSRETPRPVKELKWIVENINPKNFREFYHRAVNMRDEVLSLFSLGYLNLKDRAWGEGLFRHIAELVDSHLAAEHARRRDTSHLRRYLSKKYTCNFSVFQSLPDFWSVGQLFPIAPLQRLNEKPEMRAVLVDITCDSDGKIDRFVDPRADKRELELHSMNGLSQNNGSAESFYYLGIFLLGAYQDIMGDLHNLFGAVTEVTVWVDASTGRWHIPNIIEGDSCGEVLEYVRFKREDLRQQFSDQLRHLQQDGIVNAETAAQMQSQYDGFLSAQTYMGPR